MTGLPVHCVIPSVKDLLEQGVNLFRHESLPGISWALFFASPLDRRHDFHLCMKAIMSQNKCRATIVSAGFSLELSSSVGVVAPRQYLMPLRNFTKDASSGHVEVSRSDMAAAFCNGGSLILSGEITLALPSGSPVLRRMYESGRFSTLAIKAGNQTFNVHKSVLAECPAISDQLAPGQTEFEIAASAEAVMAMLQHLYDDPLSFCFRGLERLCCSVLLLAENFKLGKLKQLCEDALVSTIKICNVFKSARVATSANSDVLMNRALDFAVKNVNSLIFANDWTTLKADWPLTAMSICENIIIGLSGKAAETTQVACVTSTKQLSNAVPFEIPVRWEIPDFQNRMENSLCGMSIVCTEKFSHESMPGIAWELILYPNGKADYSHHVALFMRPILTSDKKCQATAPFGGFSLRFQVVNRNVASAPPPEQNLPIQQFGLQSELGFAQFAHQPLIDAHCLDKKRSAVLVGSILVEQANRQIIVNRKYLESGRQSDFTNKAFNASCDRAISKELALHCEK